MSADDGIDAPAAGYVFVDSCVRRPDSGRRSHQEPGKTLFDPSIQMPHGKTKLTEAELAIIRKWVDQGAKNN